MRFLQVYMAVLILVVISGKPHPGKNLNEGREGRQFLLRALSVPVLQPAFVQLKLSEPNPYFEADLDAEFTGRGYGQRPGQGYGYGYGFDYPGFYPQIYGYERYRPQGFENSRRGSNGTNVMNNNINSIDVVTNVNNTVGSSSETTTTTTTPAPE